MPLFFYLSGLTAKTANGVDFESDLKKSIRSVVVPYFVFSILSIVLYSIKKTPNLSRFGQQMLEMMYGVSGNEHWMSYNIPLWFFTCLFCVRIFFLGLSIWLKKPLHVLVATLLVAAAAHALFALSIPRLPWNLDVALCALVFYSAGHAWGSREVTADSIPWIGRLISCLIFAAIVYWVSLWNGRVDMNCRGFGNPLLFYIGAFSGIIAVSFIAKSLSHVRWLVAVGIASVVIFPMHGLIDYFIPARVLSILHWYAYRATGSNTASAMVFGVFEVAFCMPFFWAFMRYAPFLIGRVRIREADGTSSVVS